LPGRGSAVQGRAQEVDGLLSPKFALVQAIVPTGRLFFSESFHENPASTPHHPKAPTDTKDTS